jgi:single-stranded DNA-binding protein
MWAHGLIDVVMLALGDGDSVALAGSLTPKVWTDKEGNHRPAVDLVAHKLLTAYHVTRKRNAVQKPVGQRQPPDFDDELSDI